MSFTFKKLSIPDVILIEPKVFKDERGFFAEIFKSSYFKEAGLPDNFVQFNHSKSTKGVIRGLHYQKAPFAQGKLIRVLKGEIFDVAVDIRRKSPYFGKWLGVGLSAEKMNMIYIPVGFAHGFLTVSDEAEIEYYCTNIYSASSDRGILYNDPSINIDWHIKKPIISAKDAKLPLLSAADNDFVFGFEFLQ